MGIDKGRYYLQQDEVISIVRYKVTWCRITHDYVHGLLVVFVFGANGGKALAQES
jgi:hypothetical protein